MGKQRTIRLAAIDLGSNSFHLLIVEAYSDGHFDTLVSQKEMLGLGEVVAQYGFITDEAADLAVETVRQFVMIAKSKQVEEISAFATSAIRDAENSGDLVERIYDETELVVEVISGHTEARLIFEAIRASVIMNDATAVAFDLGGGSLEVMVGDQKSLSWATSVRLGVARLSALIQSDPPSATDQALARKHITDVLAPIAKGVQEFKPQLAIGSSGTLCDLVRMAEINRSGRIPSSVNQLSVTRDDLLAVHQQIMTLPLEERQRISGLERRRAKLIPAGSILLDIVMELFELDDFTGCEWALREGMVLDAISRHDLMDWVGDQSLIRKKSVMALGRRYGWDALHARQVAFLATEIFDQTKELHGLSDADRELLEYGALLHDIGEYVSVEGHHKHGAYLVENSNLRGFSPEDIEVLLTLVRFHRGSSPKASFRPFGHLPESRQEQAIRMTAILRLADGLDRGHSSVVEEIKIEVDDARVRIVLFGNDDLDLECWGLRHKRPLFERTFGHRVEVVSGGHPCLYDPLKTQT